jgi:hypothetical protein
MLLRTIDTKIDKIKHEGIVNVPRDNTLYGLKAIEAIIYQTKDYNSEEELSECFITQYVEYGGCSFKEED